MSKASRLKGLCNRLIAICELPAHQAKTWWRFPRFWKGGFLVRMRGFFLFAVLLSIASGIPPAFAASSSATASSNASGQTASATNQPTARCGTSAADAVEQARLSLRSNDAGAERAALTCLIEAVSALNEKSHSDEAKQASGMLHAPVRADAPNVNQ